MTARPPARTLLAVALGGALIATLGALGWSAFFHPTPIDDAYISLRAAQNFAAGLGPVFNPGERVESASSPLWTALLALLIKLGIEPLDALDLLGRVAVALAGAATALLAVELAGVAAGLVAVCALALLPAWGAWSVSGMETALAGAAIAAALLTAMRAERRSQAWIAGLFSAAAALVRPEAAALIPIFALALPREKLRSIVLPFALGAGLPLIAFLLARHAYFGAWVPNTYVAKVSGGGLGLRLRGLRYALIFFASHALLLLLASAGARRAAKEQRFGARFALLVFAVFVAVVAWDGGDHFSFWRLLVPALPLLFAALVASPPPARILNLSAAAVLFVLSAAIELRFDPSAGIFFGLSNLERYRGDFHVVRSAAATSRVLKKLPPGRLATITIGEIGFDTGWPILDLVGLTDATIARSPRLPGVYPGHDHADTAYVLAQRPDYVLLLVDMTKDRVVEEGEMRALVSSRRYLAAALDLRMNPAFQKDWAPIDIEEAPGRHLRLWVRKDLIPPR